MQNEGLSGEGVEEVMRINVDLPEAQNKPRFVGPFLPHTRE